MAAIRKSSSAGKSRSREPEAIAMLIADHRKIRKLFVQFASSDEDSEKDYLCQQLCTMLTVHNSLEEELFYPAARNALDDAGAVDEAEVEHGVAGDLVAQLQRYDLEPDQRDASFEQLCGYVLQHFREEESQLFKQVMKADIDFDELADDMRARREELDTEYDLSNDDDEDEGEDEDEAYVKQPARGRRLPSHVR